MSRFALVFGVTAALAASGCAQLAGIDNTTGGGGGGGVDGGGDDGGPSAASSIQFQRFSIGTSVLETPQSVAGVALPTFDTAGGPVTGVAMGANGWSTDQVATDVRFDLPGGPAGSPPQPELWALGAPNLKGFVSSLERPGGGQPAPSGATVDITLNLDTAVATGDGFELYDVGAWSAVGLGATVGNTTVTATAVPYTQFTSLNRRGTLDAIATGDAVLGLRYATGGQLTGVVDLPGFTQTGSDTITGAVTAVALDQTLNMTVQAASATSRMAATLPAGGTPVAQWGLSAAPGAQLSENTGPTLLGGTSTNTDTTAAGTFANPFLASHGWHSTFTWVTNAQRTYTPTVGSLANLPITGLTEMASVSEPTAGGTASLDAGMPTNITIGSTLLTTDGVAIADDPTQPIAVTFSADVPTNTVYEVEVIETTALSGQASDNGILEYIGTSPSFQLPPNTLTAGHTYRLRAVCRAGGYPNIAQGDLTATSLPISIGLQDSGVFTVGTPQ